MWASTLRTAASQLSRPPTTMAAAPMMATPAVLVAFGLQQVG